MKYTFVLEKGIKNCANCPMRQMRRIAAYDWVCGLSGAILDINLWAARPTHCQLSEVDELIVTSAGPIEENNQPVHSTIKRKYMMKVLVTNGENIHQKTVKYIVEACNEEEALVELEKKLKQDNYSLLFYELYNEIK